MTLTLTFLGTGAAIPSLDRNVASLALAREGETLLFDCGEGTQRQMMRYGVSFSLRDIFFTHFHADHLLGLTGLVRTLGLQDRTDPLRLYGPRGARRVLEHALAVGIERNKFPVEVEELAAGDVVSRPEYDVVAVEADHRAPSLAYVLVEHTRLGRFQPERVRELGVPEGPLWGRLHRGETVQLPDGRSVGPTDLVGPPRPGRKVAISGDTRPSRAIAEAARGADLLVHEATFSEEEAEKAEQTGHSTAAAAAMLAREAGVRRLVLTHISARYTREAPELVAEAQAIFPESMVARDGLIVDVPFPDAGIAA
ncbi:MAG TPA: ribonuclease Z [Gemmatimonadales bacterium]|nr:ribonuclease Z [Gemmatimonadales bacterium]